MEEQDHQGEDFQVGPDSCVTFGAGCRVVDEIDCAFMYEDDPKGSEEPEKSKAKRVQCLICQHPDREAIEAEALAGSVRATGRKWELCYTSIAYHLTMHYAENPEHLGVTELKEKLS